MPNAGIDYDQLDPEQFASWRDGARDRAGQQSIGEIVDDLMGWAENGETMTLNDAKILGAVYELKDRVDGGQH